MPTSLAFYRDILGFQVMSEIPSDGRCDWVRLGLAGSELMLNTVYEAHERPAAPDPARMAAHGDVVLYFACDDADATYAYLRARNIPAREPISVAYGMRQVYLKDPDGYEICLQHPTGA